MTNKECARVLTAFWTDMRVVNPDVRVLGGTVPCGEVKEAIEHVFEHWAVLSEQTDQA